MCKRYVVWLTLLSGLPLATGCESSVESGGSSGPTVEQIAARQKETSKEATPAAATPSEQAATRGDVPAETGSSEPAIAQKASDRPPLQTQGGYAGAVFGANRTIRIMADDLAWKKSVQLFEAEHGRKPKDTQEFMERIRSEGTPLPSIEPGTKYLDMPDEGQFGELYQVPADAPEGVVPASGNQ
jgi:hypothetical protein